MGGMYDNEVMIDEQQGIWERPQTRMGTGTGEAMSGLSRNPIFTVVLRR
jgi:hypothetical protein